MLKRDGEPTLIGCPGCAGVLTTMMDGQEDFVRYVCTVGHSYSTPALIEAKEQQFEHGMWAVISMLAHLDMAYSDLLEQCQAGLANAPRGAMNARIQQVRGYARALREMVEQDRPPALESAEDERETA